MYSLSESPVSSCACAVYGHSCDLLGIWSSCLHVVSYVVVGPNLLESLVPVLTVMSHSTEGALQPLVLVGVPTTSDCPVLDQNRPLPCWSAERPLVASGPLCHCFCCYSSTDIKLPNFSKYCGTEVLVQSLQKGVKRLEGVPPIW